MAPGKLVIGVVTGLLLLSLAQPGYTEYARHHIGTVLGLFFAPDRGSFALLRAVNYRFSVNPHVDLVIDGRGWWVPVWVDEALDVTFVGGGVRLNGDAGYVKAICTQLKNASLKYLIHLKQRKRSAQASESVSMPERR